MLCFNRKWISPSCNPILPAAQTYNLIEKHHFQIKRMPACSNAPSVFIGIWNVLRLDWRIAVWHWRRQKRVLMVLRAPWDVCSGNRKKKSNHELFPGFFLSFCLSWLWRGICEINQLALVIDGRWRTGGEFVESVCFSSAEANVFLLFVRNKM